MKVCGFLGLFLNGIFHSDLLYTLSLVDGDFVSYHLQRPVIF